MENASKAIIMAGGVLLTIAMVSLLIFGWNKFSDYYSSDDDLADIDDLTKFNLQFTNYERDDVHGYELISLANKVTDYNKRKSSATGNTSNDGYNPIKLNIYFKGKQSTFRYDSDATREGETLFKDHENIEGISNIINEAAKIAGAYRGDDNATKLAKSINALILTDAQLSYNLNNKHMLQRESKRQALADYISIVGEDNTITYKSYALTSEDIKPNQATSESTIESEMQEDDKKIGGLYDAMVEKLTSKSANIMAYYEYYQFKKGIFKCEDQDAKKGIKYDQATGRVSEIDFTFTEKIE